MRKFLLSLALILGLAVSASAQNIRAGTISGATLAADNIWSDYKVLAATAVFDNTNTLANLTGFSWSLTAGKTYQFEIELYTTQTTVGGLSVAFKYTTLTLTSIQVYTYQSTATDNATAVSTQSTTTTDATKFVDNKTAAYTVTRIRGTLVVNAAGTLNVQAAQNTAATGADVTDVLLGSWARFTRVN